MNRTPSSISADPMQAFGDMIDLTRQAHTNSVQLMLDSWEGGLEFFANLLKQAEEMAARNSAMPTTLA